MSNKLIETGYLRAKAGGPPADWGELLIMNVDTRELEFSVFDIDVEEGWILQGSREVPENFILPSPQKKRGNFAILRFADVEGGHEHGE